MATLASLKLTAAKKPTQLPAAQVRRNKLCLRLQEQIQLAKAKQSGTPFVARKSRIVKDAETGLRQAVQLPKRVKEWWFTTDSGKIALSVRYGARALELAKGKSAVEVASVNDLVPTLEVLKSAVEAGELDTAMEAASGALREGFKR